jgi:hypothetical protein
MPTYYDLALQKPNSAANLQTSSTLPAHQKTSNPRCSRISAGNTVLLVGAQAQCFMLLTSSLRSGESCGTRRRASIESRWRRLGRMDWTEIGMLQTVAFCAVRVGDLIRIVMGAGLFGIDLLCWKWSGWEWRGFGPLEFLYVFNRNLR